MGIGVQGLADAFIKVGVVRQHFAESPGVFLGGGSGYRGRRKPASRWVWSVVISRNPQVFSLFLFRGGSGYRVWRKPESRWVWSVKISRTPRVELFFFFFGVSFPKRARMSGAASLDRRYMRRSRVFLYDAASVGVLLHACCLLWTSRFTKIEPGHSRLEMFRAKGWVKRLALFFAFS